MEPPELSALIAAHLRVLVEQIGPRPPGSPANRHATAYLRQRLIQARLPIEEYSFRSKYWSPGPASLETPGGVTPVEPNPFSPPCDVSGEVVHLTSVIDLDVKPMAGRVAVLGGALAATAYFPKAYPFVSFPDQLEVLEKLEAAGPAAVIAVAATEPPHQPIFEDADLAFPSVTISPSVAARLADGDRIRLCLSGETTEGDGVNLSGFIGAGRHERRSLIAAHVDTKATTPGAFDNGGGVATLLAAVEAGMFADCGPIEVVFFNGEDHYAAPGEQAWLAANQVKDVRLMLNLDGVGATGRSCTVAAFALSPAAEGRLRGLVQERLGWSVAPPWYESDHAIFAMQGIPSLALSSAGAHDLLLSLAHTPDDTIDRVDPLLLSDVAAFLPLVVRTVLESKN